ncbi:MAG: protease-4 [Cognaticolwellia sp.]|jgi:protease-4
MNPLLLSLARPFSHLTAWVGRRALLAALGDTSVLELRLDGTGDPLLLLSHLEFAASRPGVRGVLLQLGAMGWGWATLQEWRAGLQRIREKGVSVVVYAETPGNAGLYLSSAADRVVVPPMGEVTLLGVGGQLRFFGPALERLGLEFDVVSAGAYKSLGESFTRRVASAENREATELLVKDLQTELMSALSLGRGLTETQLEEAMDTGALSPEEALQAGLIDRVAYESELDDFLEELLGRKCERVDMGQLIKPLAVLRQAERHSRGLPEVAVLHLRGNITMGTEPGGRQRIAPPEVIPAIRALKEDPRVQAVVLAVNSPGGSVLASDLIWKEIQLLDQVKPVVAYFGDVSASGGYYISAPARAIYACPGTITGSIGVVGGKLVTGAATAKLGIFSEAVGGGPMMGMYRSEQPFDPKQRERFRARLQMAYKGFVERVAQGRKRSVEEIEPMAQGRVWAGASALEGGLVDGLGGLTQALEKARELAKLHGPWSRRDTVVKPPARFWAQFLPGGLITLLAPQLSVLQPWLSLPPAAELLMQAPGQALAIMPVEIDIS